MFNGRHYYLIAIIIIALSMIPLICTFERKKPQARKLVVIAALVTIAVISRTVFYMIPFFKPMLAVVIISGIGLGWECGFIVGTASAFMSNFIFGQGPWTPWQMFAMGAVGLISGLIFSKKYNADKMKIPVCIYGFLCAVVIYGGIMDTASVLMYSNDVNAGLFTAAYISGFPVNVIHGISTIIFLALLQKGMIKKLNRVKIKYSI